MNTMSVLLGVLLAVASVLCAVAVWALVELVRTARSVRVLADDLDARAVPLLDKADITVDALNAEMLRVDGIVTRFEEISDRVESTTRTVQEVANAPAEIVTDIADRVRRAWKHRKSQSTTSEGDDVAAEPTASTGPGPAGSDESQPVDVPSDAETAQTL